MTCMFYDASFRYAAVTTTQSIIEKSLIDADGYNAYKQTQALLFFMNSISTYHPLRTHSLLPTKARPED